MKARIAALAWALAGALGSLGAVEMDGVVGRGEYANRIALDGEDFVLSWQMEGDTVSFAIESRAGGWVAVGFEPTRVMANADMVFGIVSDTVQAVDAYSTGTFGPHPPDVEQGGRSDILAFAGRRSEGRVTFEFSRRLDTGDSKDKPIARNGNLRLIWAWSNSLSFTAKHTKAGTVSLALGQR